VANYLLGGTLCPSIALFSILAVYQKCLTISKSMTTCTPRLSGNNNNSIKPIYAYFIGAIAIAPLRIDNNIDWDIKLFYGYIKFSLVCIGKIVLLFHLLLTSPPNSHHLPSPSPPTATLVF